jgi:hypothetical protein
MQWAEYRPQYRDMHILVFFYTTENFCRKNRMLRSYIYVL